jgi:hypothetical protein
VQREAATPPFFDFDQRRISAMDRNDFQALLRLRHELAGMRFEIALEQFRRKYSDSQPRVPAGQPGGGQWTGTGGGDGSADILLAGGIDDADKSKTVQQFMSEKCKGYIKEEMPGQFLNMPISEMLYMLDNGDQAAKTCFKLLARDKYRK